MTNEKSKILKKSKFKVGKNQIYFDELESLFVVEKYEDVKKGRDIFSVVDEFKTFEEAYDVAQNPNRYLRKCLKRYGLA